ncbi:hypothetical protein ORV05_08220 [Amycolatopsis cynarae]|uniref:Uncharacterized protein n=1 Tax=Amycolatopsis cynarae TaxID=2995223 RepID=A0ABY7B930_9PSEU|nr:hypothetical protein [Amycolatopsis sp. HUAS 11-8]WAL67747.1 hypothetical protein ORV05_08220 [Amycolatopsis sp. HUAS 11-8]
MGDVEKVFEFAGTGRLGSLTVGASVCEVLGIMGTPDGVTGELPAICAYGDLQLGFSGDGILWHLAVEPSGLAMVLPSPIGSGDEATTPSMSEFMSHLRRKVERVVRCEPFVAGEYWWLISGSGVLLSFDDQGFLVAAHRSDPSLVD